MVSKRALFYYFLSKYLLNYFY